MSETTESQFCLDPNVLIKLVHHGEVNGHPVLDYGTDGNRTYVLCFLGNDNHDSFVTWSIWRTEHGVIAAEHGHYHAHISDAVIDLRGRADGRAGLNDLVRDIEAEKAGLRR